MDVAALRYGIARFLAELTDDGLAWALADAADRDDPTLLDMALREREMRHVAAEQRAVWDVPSHVPAAWTREA